MLSGSFSELCGLKIRYCLAFFSSIILLFLYSCEDEPVKRDYPRVNTLEVSNITEAGATFNAEVFDEGNVEIDDHGFFWSTYMISPASSEKVSLGAFDGTGDFSADITTTLEEGAVYIVSAYLKAGEYTVFGEEMKFTSLGSGAPEIIGFNPTLAGWGDTIVITGRKFSNLSLSNKIIIEDQVCTPFYASDTLLKFRLPASVTQPLNTVSVSISGNIATAVDKLTLIPPEVYGFAPLEGHWGDTITFSGLRLDFLGQKITDGALLDGGILSKIISRSSDTASFVIPGQLGTTPATLSLTYGPFTFSFDQTLTLLPPEVDSVSPVEGTWGSSVTLYGKFNPLSTMNTVLFDNISAKVLYTSIDNIQVEVPQTLVNPESVVTYKAGPFTSAFSQTFKLKGPEIREFSPTNGAVGALVTIKGKFFKAGLTSVKIGGETAPIRTINDTIITCHVPGNIYDECTLSVTVLEKTTNADVSFSSTNHRITGLDHSYVNYGDTVTVYGEYFRSGIAWRLGNVVVTPFSLSPGEMKFVIPVDMTYVPARIGAVYNYYYSGISLQTTSISEDELNLNDFTVTDVTPLSGKVGDILEITGTNFGVVSVAFGSGNAVIIQSSRTGITVRVPPLSSGEHDINITSGNKTYIYPSKYTHSGPWHRLNDLPFLYDYACVFDFGEEVFVATAGASAYSRDVYLFNVDNYGFEKVGDNVGSEIMNPISCVLGDKGYIIGHKVANSGEFGFEVFNPDSMTWRSLPQYPGSTVVNPCIVADDSVIYAGGGRWAVSAPSAWQNDFWKYSPKTNCWTRLADFPGSRTYFSNQIYLNGKIFFKTGTSVISTMYEYLPDMNIWSQVVGNLPQDASGARVNAELNGKWYLGFGDAWAFHGSYGVTDPGINNRFYCFDPSTNLLKTIQNVAVSRRTFPMSFSAGGYIFIGGSQHTHLYDFWMYDPELDE